MKRPGSLVTAGVVLLGGGALAGYWLATQPSNPSGMGDLGAQAWQRVPADGHVKPLRIPPVLPKVSLVRDWNSIDVLSKRIWPRHKDSLGVVVHALRAFESDSTAPAGAEYPAWSELKSVMMDTATNQSWYGQRYSMVQTREGLRYVKSEEDSASLAHDDQGVSVLAELGVALNEVLSTPAGPMPVRALLSDTVANFHMNGELDWAAVALGLYLPPQRTWRNKLNEEHSFDDLVKESFSRPLTEGACDGAHKFYALALLLRVDRTVPILGEPTRRDLEMFLRRLVEAVRRSQLPNGAFPSSWSREIVGAAWYWDLVEASDNNNIRDNIRKVREWNIPRGAAEGEKVSGPTSGSFPSSRSRPLSIWRGSLPRLSTPVSGGTTWWFWAFKGRMGWTWSTPSTGARGDCGASRSST